MQTLNPEKSVIDTLGTSREKFIGQPLKSLYKKHSFSRKSFVLFCENPDGSGRKRLGDNLNLSLLILKNPKYADHTVASIQRYYDEIHVVVNPPRKGKGK